MAAALRNLDVFDHFVDACLHGVRWSRHPAALIPASVFGRQVCTVFSNRQHAERMAIREARGLLPQLRFRQDPGSAFFSFKIFLSYAPCLNCSNALTRFVRTLRNSLLETEVWVEVVISALYRVRRPSCRARRCRHLDRVSQRTHDRNVRSIRRLLRRERFHVRTMHGEDWRCLGQELGVPSLYAEVCAHVRVSEDRLMLQDFQRLFPAGLRGRQRESPPAPMLDDNDDDDDGNLNNRDQEENSDKEGDNEDDNDDCVNEDGENEDDNKGGDNGGSDNEESDDEDAGNGDDSLEGDDENDGLQRAEEDDVIVLGSDSDDSADGADLENISYSTSYSEDREESSNEEGDGNDDSVEGGEEDNFGPEAEEECVLVHDSDSDDATEDEGDS